MPTRLDETKLIVADAPPIELKPDYAGLDACPTMTHAITPAPRRTRDKKEKKPMYAHLLPGKQDSVIHVYPHFFRHYYAMLLPSSRNTQICTMATYRKVGRDTRATDQ